MNALNLATASILHQSSAVLIAAACVALAVLGRRVWPARAALLAAAITLSAETGIRAAITGRAPLVGTYENTLVVALLIAIASALVLFFAAPAVRSTLARLTAPWALAALAFGWRFSSQPLPIGAEGRGALAFIHGAVGWIDFTVLLVGTMAALGMLLSRKSASSAWQPLVTRLLGSAFALLTATMASGALLSFGVFGSWYQWQIAETLAAALWLGYGFLLHAYLLFGWRDRRLAALVIALLPLSLAAFWSWSIYPATYHYFERILGS